MEEYIGIIVKNQWNNILLYDNSFYIKAKVNNESNINNIIKQVLVETLNKDIFNIKKTYKEKLKKRQHQITMYLVEVGVYNNDFEFIEVDKIYDEILNFEEKDYFKKNILKYEDCTTSVNIIINFMVAIIILNILPMLNSIEKTNKIAYTILGLVVIYLIINFYLKDKIVNYLMLFKINFKALSSVMIIIFIIYCIKIFI